MDNGQQGYAAALATSHHVALRASALAFRWAKLSMFWMMAKSMSHRNFSQFQSSIYKPFIENPACVTGGLIFFLLQHCADLGCLYTCSYRNKLKDRYNLPEEPCLDLLSDCCCLACSICQTYRELQNRGVDLFSGGNSSNQPPSTNGQANAPPQQFMQK